MSFYFENFPEVNYSLKKNFNFELLTNVTVRFKIREVIKNNALVFYEYNVRDDDRPDIVATKYYGDPTLDWLILMTNDMIDPYYDWPLNYLNFNNYIKSLYGSVASAKTSIYEYRQILNQQSVLFDGTIVPKRTIVVDLNTFNSLPAASRETIYGYNYYEEENNKKRRIKIIDKEFVSIILNEVENIFSR
jgi:hypothetical protein